MCFDTNIVTSFLNTISSKCFFLVIECSAAEPWQIMFQDPATPIMEGIISFHNDLMVFAAGVCIFVLYLLIRSVNLFMNNENSQRQVEGTTSRFVNSITHHTSLEVVWTIVPAIMLLIVAVPSFALLYSIEEFVEPSLTVTATGHQWYWSYEYSNFKKVDFNGLFKNYKFDSYMVETASLDEGNLRLLEVDRRLLLPVGTHIQMSITASDVLHCWAVPAFGIKVDACPGRINQTTIYIKRGGVYYGQCSEICGINHGFMPIVVRAVSTDEFMTRHYVRLLNGLDD